MGYNALKAIGNISVLCLLIFSVNADTPANCTYQDIQGTWTFSMGKGNQGRSINCSSFVGATVSQLTVQLKYPDVAVDQFNNKGFWTIVYNQGFEVVVGGRKYFAFSKFAGNDSFCSQTMPGLSHDLLGRDWACYTGSKTSSVPGKVNSNYHVDSSLRFGHKINSDEIVQSINSRRTSWTAVKYDQWNGMNHDGFVRMAGGEKSRVVDRPKASPLTEDQMRIRDSLPDQFDWRDVNGQDFMSPVRNQGGCGSCYSFASLAMNEARVRILTNNTHTPVFSPQDIVECSPYSQGCAGGFPYLIGGKYAEDYGLVEESWNPYTGKDGSCRTDPKAPRHYSTKYRYVGGYYGACNEAVMMQALYTSGPIAVGFEVYKDFFNYHSGIYHHTTGAGFGYNPFELTNHAVLVVGWGVESGQKYWIVKNSWGEKFGLQGYFWISRGNDECGIESMAVEAFPMLTFNH